MERTYEGYNPDEFSLGLIRGPHRRGYPNGDPNLPYFRLHGSDLGFTYGNQDPLRNEQDLIASQVISGYFAQFAKTGDPNPPLEYLRVRGYMNVSHFRSPGRPSLYQTANSTLTDIEICRRGRTVGCCH